MLKRDLLLMANRNLWRRRARTILTCLGVLIGAASIVVMLSLGIGLKESMEKSMAQWGSLNIVRVHPGMQFDQEGNPTGEERRLNDETVAELKTIPGVAAVSPTYTVYGEAMLGRKRGHINLVGMDVQTMEQMEFTLAHGRLPSSDERFTVVAGYQVINNFVDERAMRRGGMPNYEPQDPLDLLDQRIRLTINNQADYEKKQTFNIFVVGILDEKNMERSWEVYGSISDIKRMRDFMLQGANNQMAQSFGPGMAMVHRGAMVSVSQQASKPGSKQDDRRNNYDSILVRTKDVADTKRISAELRERGFNAWSMADGLEGIERTSRTIQAILGGIGGITLFVAALGITNTMIMSIYERTREIGIMKVIGASFSDVRALFLAEASLIGLFGGIFGLGLSYGASAVINKISSQYMQQGMFMGGGETLDISIIPPWLALFAVVFAIFIGLGSGLYPANRAIKLSPIVAIRNE